MESNLDLIDSGLRIDETAKSHLSETAKWGVFLAIVGFVLSGIIAIFALFAGSLLSSMSDGYGSRRGSGIGAGFVTAVYLIIGIVYFFMSLFLYRFATKMKAALAISDQETLNNSFMNLKNLYRMMGIITIIYLCFLVLAVILGVGASLMR